MRSEPIQVVLDGLRRRPVLEVTLACLAVLLLAQALIGALSLSALNRLVVDTTADRVEVVAVSYTHLDVYKRQGQISSALPFLDNQWRAP